MDEQELRELITDTGRELLNEGLVARTWGNVSARIDNSSFFITPSGLDYTKTKPEDIVRYNGETKEWQGLHKPSSEKGIHAAAYEIFPDVGFVIHTHQVCASAIGLAGFEKLDANAEELKRLGGIAQAQYGLPGTKMLREAVKAAMKSGAKSVLMVSHGALVCGKDKTDAMEKVKLLEEICRRNLILDSGESVRAENSDAEKVINAAREAYQYADAADTDALLKWAERGVPLKAQLDDMAQMLGPEVKCVPCDAQAVLNELGKRDGVLVKGVGAIVKSDSEDDTRALKLLLDKAAVCALHTEASGKKIKLSGFETTLMRLVYKKKYSKQKG